MAISASQNRHQHLKTRKRDSTAYHTNMTLITTLAHPRTPTHSKNPSAIITLTEGLETPVGRSIRPPTPHTSHHEYSPTLVPLSPVDDLNFTTTLRSKLAALKRDLETNGHVERICNAHIDPPTPISPISRDENMKHGWWDVLGIDNVRESARNIPDIWKIHERERARRKRSLSS